jgi:hypothetical protein
MKVKIGRHDPCPGGSGKKLKKCGETLPASPASAASYSWMARNGVHVVAPGGPLTPAAWDHLIQTYHRTKSVNLRCESRWFKNWARPKQKNC